MPKNSTAARFKDRKDPRSTYTLDTILLTFHPVYLRFEPSEIGGTRDKANQWARSDPDRSYCTGSKVRVGNGSCEGPPTRASSVVFRFYPFLF